MDPNRIVERDPAFAATLARRHDAGQGAGAWQRLLPAIAADIAAQPLLSPAELHGIDCPAMVVCGDRDPFVPPEHAAGLARQLPAGRLFVAPDCGHEVMARRPGLFNEALSAFYRAHRGRGPHACRARRADRRNARRYPMTTLLVLYRAPEGGEAALAELERRYGGEHMPLVAQTPGLRASRVWRVTEAMGAETDLVLAAALDFDDRAAMDEALRSEPMRAASRVLREIAPAWRRSSSSRTRRTCSAAVGRASDTVRTTVTTPRPPDHENLHVNLPAPGTEGPIDGVALVVIDRHEVLNALDFALIEVLTDALEALDRDPACRAIVITGAGDRAFAAGADIPELGRQTPTTLTVDDTFHRWERIKRIRKPLIAAVRGFALGGGCELAMLCDMIVAGEDAQFGQPEIKLGVMPGAGGTQRLTRAIGKARAMEMILTGRNMDAREAEAHGLVSQVVPSDETVPAALALAGRIAEPRAGRGDGGQGRGEPRRGAAARGRPRVRAPELLPAVRYRGRGRGHGRVRREAQADLEGPLMGFERDLGDEPAPVWRDTAPDLLSPIDADAPVSGHVPASDAGTPPALAVEHDWTAASVHVFPVLRPEGTHGTMLAEVDPDTLAAEGLKKHALPLVDPGPAGLAVAYALRSPAYDVLVNADHLLAWGIEADTLREAAMDNLRAWSTAAPWSDELSGERRLISSDTSRGLRRRADPPARGPEASRRRVRRPGAGPRGRARSRPAHRRLAAGGRPGLRGPARDVRRGGRRGRARADRPGAVRARRRGVASSSATRAERGPMIDRR